MKKILYLMLLAILSLSFTACGDDDGPIPGGGGGGGEGGGGGGKQPQPTKKMLPSKITVSRIEKDNSKTIYISDKLYYDEQNRIVRLEYLEGGRNPNSYNFYYSEDGKLSEVKNNNSRRKYKFKHTDNRILLSWQNGGPPKIFRLDEKERLVEYVEPDISFKWLLEYDEYDNLSKMKVFLPPSDSFDDQDFYTMSYDNDHFNPFIHVNKSSLWYLMLLRIDYINNYFLNSVSTKKEQYSDHLHTGEHVYIDWTHDYTNTYNKDGYLISRVEVVWLELEQRIYSTTETVIEYQEPL